MQGFFDPAVLCSPPPRLAIFAGWVLCPQMDKAGQISQGKGQAFSDSCDLLKFEDSSCEESSYSSQTSPNSF